MKIRSSDAKSSVEQAGGTLPASRPGRATSSPGVSAPPDYVQLTSLAHSPAANENSPGHVARLQSLNGIVSGGRYHVDAGVLSNHLIEANMRFSGSAF